MPTLCSELAALQKSGFNNFRSGFVLAEARGLAQLGRHADALAMIDATIAACRGSGERWCLPELFRLKGRLILDEAKPAAAKMAAEYFQIALDEARADGAVEWERRITADVHQAVALDSDPATPNDGSGRSADARPSALH